MPTQITMWKANDGTVFGTEKEANVHELDLKLRDTIALNVSRYAGLDDREEERDIVDFIMKRKEEFVTIFRNYAMVKENL